MIRVYCRIYFDIFLLLFNDKKKDSENVPTQKNDFERRLCA